MVYIAVRSEDTKGVFSCRDARERAAVAGRYAGLECMEFGEGQFNEAVAWVEADSKQELV